MPGVENRPVSKEVQGLLREQWRAYYDIINWHLNKTLNRNKPQQLLMIIPGEGGVGKSKTIQTITENFHWRGAAHLLAKSAYTGIAALIIDGKTLHMICQKQYPLMTAYAFTDRSQGQTIQNAIIDITSPPTGALTPFNIYVALSRCHGREGICLLHDFDDKLVTSHPSEYLRMEDERLMRLDNEMEEWWNSMQSLGK